MRRLQFGGILMVVSTVLLVAGGIVFAGGRNGLGGLLVAAALIGYGLVIAPALASEGRAAEQQGMMGRRSEVPGFDRPPDQSGL